MVIRPIFQGAVTGPCSQPVSASEREQGCHKYVTNMSRRHAVSQTAMLSNQLESFFFDVMYSINELEVSPEGCYAT